MPSLLPGFEYDIFISYRHNDNLDGWVTDFVQNLEKELRGTLKETVTIYFDKNPHDGLLETHSVDKSLEGKLKCLIFIPIISQTYCDPKSFAWQHEFCAFNKIASRDEGIGRDIKLSNGNVASRILPVRIHDLDSEDQSLLEHELGGVLRPVDFIYKEAGVNRPLKQEDRKEDNLNRTAYRNQVNKVANAIKEIITAIKKPVQPNGRPSQKQEPVVAGTANLNSRKAVLVVTLLIAAIVILYFIFGPNRPNPEVTDKSIAVLPFVNMSNDPDQEYFSDGIAEEVINALSEVPELRVVARTSSFQFKGKNLDIRKIGDSLKVAFVLEGTVRKSKEQLRIGVRLIRTSDASEIWSKPINRKAGQDLDIQDEIARIVATTLQASLLNKSLDLGSEIKITNAEAFDLYLKGRYFFNMRGDGLAKALDLYKQAVAVDSTYAPAYAGVAGCYTLLAFYKMIPAHRGIDDARKWASVSIALDPNIADAYAYQAFALLYMEYDWVHAEEYLKKAMALNPHDGFPKGVYGNFLLWVKGDALAAEESARRTLQLDPFSVILHNQLGNSLLVQGKNDEALVWFQKAIDLNDKSEVALTSTSAALMKLNRVEDARKVIETGLIVTGRTQSMLIAWIDVLETSGQLDEVQRIYDEILEMNLAGKADDYTLGVAAAALGKKEEALGHFESALDQKNSGFINWSPFRPYQPHWLVSLQKEPRYEKIMNRLAYPKK